MLILIAIILILVGLLSLLAKDRMWQLTEFINQINGRASERTEVWDFFTSVSGFLFLVLGFILLLYALP